MEHSSQNPTKRIKLEKQYDIAVIGDGPAGHATAIFLAQAGYRVLLVASKSRPYQKAGENLSSQANCILQELGIWNDFLGSGHLPSFGKQTAWGKAHLTFHDDTHNDAGPGWLIDRPALEQLLMQQAKAAGVTVTANNPVRRVRKHERGWDLTLGGLPAPVVASFVVDATGTSSWLARHQGVQRIHTDNQVALIATLETSGVALCDSTTLTEAAPSGWWYSARTPNGRLAISFMTDIDLHSQQQACTASGWHKLLDQTRYTARRVYGSSYHLAETPKFVSAGSSRLAQFWGKGWLAVGDAAASHDPLSTHGLTLALLGARDAAQTIEDHLNGDEKALAGYGDKLDWAFSYYALIRNRFYRNEPRWLNAPYWHRRNRQTAVLV